MAIEAGRKITFTITKVPARQAQRKTLTRLMRMQRSIQNGLRRLSKRRERDLNVTHPRAGREWTSRVKATKLVNVATGETFTLDVTPQILADLRSVEKYLSAKG